MVDLSDKTVTPGMIDAHVHADAFDNDKMFMETIFASSTYRALGTLHTLQHALRRGFTAIRVPGTIEPFDYGIADVARSIERGYFDGARLVYSFGALGTPGGHTDLSQRLYQNPLLAEMYTSKVQGLGNGADFFRGAVRQQVKYGAQFIKIMASGGFASPNDSPEDKQLTDEEFAAIIDTAHALGKPCTAHVYAPYVMQCLLDLGIDGMEHGSLMDEETAERFEQSGTYLVPTFLPYEEIVHPDEEKLAKKEPGFQRKLRLYQERLQRSREVIRRSNIRLGYGTDLVAVYQPYENGREYACWLRSGMDPFRPSRRPPASTPGSWAWTRWAPSSRASWPTSPPGTGPAHRRERPAGLRLCHEGRRGVRDGVWAGWITGALPWRRPASPFPAA